MGISSSTRQGQRLAHIRRLNEIAATRGQYPAAEPPGRRGSLTPKRRRPGPIARHDGATLPERNACHRHCALIEIGYQPFTLAILHGIEPAIQAAANSPSARLPGALALPWPSSGNAACATPRSGPNTASSS